MSLFEEVRKRRTFAIISHPDAGKTTLTEKFLLYGGALQLAGSVSAKKKQRQVTSDWMDLERQRGISISSTVLNFSYNGYIINLLDTPGHQDFSEDTYRTLMAADSVIMLIDNAKGVETQTRKLFEVCRMRKIPVVTFINKMDRFGKEPLGLLDEIEQHFGIKTYPFNWPIGEGEFFKGVYDRIHKTIHLFEKTEHGKYKAPMQVSSLNDEKVRELLPGELYSQLVEELEILDIAGSEYSHDTYLDGDLTPVFFGSAMTNFGIEQFLNHFLELAPAPQSKKCRVNGLVHPADDGFSGFIFKIQANMDPNHRDCIAFLRICSGSFERNMAVEHPKTGKTVRLNYSHKLFGQDRETIDQAFAGDIIGFSYNKEPLSIGDTLSIKPCQYEMIPPFPPEMFALVRNKNPDKFKQFTKGIRQLALEGVIQVLHFEDDLGQTGMILGAVGQLQFEVFQYRLQTEYNIEIELNFMPEYTHARWIHGPAEKIETMYWQYSAKKVTDSHDRLMALFQGEWSIDYMQEKNPDIEFLKVPPTDT